MPLVPGLLRPHGVQLRVMWVGGRTGIRGRVGVQKALLGQLYYLNKEPKGIISVRALYYPNPSAEL